MPTYKSSYLVAYAALCLIGFAPGANAGLIYTFTDIGAVSQMAGATGINNSRVVIGNSNVGNTPATVWNGVVSASLPGGVWGINATGQVVGASVWKIAGQDALHATLWNGTTPTDLGVSIGKSSATAINDAGQVVGVSGDTHSNGQATVWNGTTATVLYGQEQPFGVASDINNAGLVVGTVYNFNGGVYHSFATQWIGFSPTTLGTLGGVNSEAASISEPGLIVGASQNATGATHATLWTGVTPTDLGTLGGQNSVALGINGIGQIVGQSEVGGNTSGTHATLWDGFVATDLNSFLDSATTDAGWVLFQAIAINDNGWIVGTASNSLTGEQHAFLLSPSPMPEPGTLSLLALGLTGIGYLRKKTSMKHPAASSGVSGYRIPREGTPQGAGNIPAMIKVASVPNISWLKTVLQGAGVVKRSQRRGKHRIKRERAPLPGMMVHQDASTRATTRTARWLQSRSRLRPSQLCSHRNQINRKRTIYLLPNRTVLVLFTADTL